MTYSGTTDDLVSIVIPVFNGARLVGEAIDSALAQSWPNIEVIVVDDGSDDGGATQRVLARYGDAIRVVSKPNGGVATAINAGIAAMRGKWFSWLSHDDLYHPLKIERYLAALRGVEGPAVAFGDIDFVDEGGRLQLRHSVTQGFEGTDGRRAAAEARLHGCAMLVPRICLETCGIFDARLPTTQDCTYWFRLGQLYPFVPVPEPLMRSRVHDGQGSRALRHLEEGSLLWAWMLDELEAADPDASPQVRLRRLLRIVRVLHITHYAGARALYEDRLDGILAGAQISVLLPAANPSELDAVIGVLAETSVGIADMVVLDLSPDAGAALDLAKSVARRGGTLLRLGTPGSTIDASALLQAADRLGGSAVAFLDPAALPATDILREGLLAIMAGEADGWLSGRTAPGSLLPIELAGAVLHRDAVHAAVADRAGSAFSALLRNARLIGAAPLSRVPLPPRPEPPAGVVSSDAHPNLSRPPQAGRPTLLLLVHGWGGGTIRYTETLAASIAGRCNLLFGWGIENRRFHLSSLGPETPEWVYDLDAGLPPLLQAMRQLAVTRIDVLHEVGFDQWTDDFLDQLGVPFDITFLDYHLVASGPHMIDEAGRFVGDAALLRTDHPARRTGPLRPLVRAAERRIACSRDLASRIGRLVPGLPVLAARLPEPGNPSGFIVYVPPLADDEVMRVIYLGRVAPHKGMALIPEVARQANARGVKLCIYCLGADSLFPDAAQQRDGIRLLGPYRQEELNTLVCRLRPHLAWLPFTAAETHSFSLSDAMLQGLPVLATGIGAVVERLEGRPSTWLLPPEEADVDGFVEWLVRLRRDRLTTPPRWLPTAHLPPLADRFYEQDYLRPLFRQAGA